jgi:hypothetical protein
MSIPFNNSNRRVVKGTGGEKCHIELAMGEKNRTFKLTVPSPPKAKGS